MCDSGTMRTIGSDNRKRERDMQRVQIPAYSDLWMRGARFGVVTGTARAKNGEKVFIVKMDHPQVKKPARFIADDCTHI